MSRAEICLEPCVMNFVGKVVPNVTALMLLPKGNLKYHGSNLSFLQQEQPLTLHVFHPAPKGKDLSCRVHLV